MMPPKNSRKVKKPMPFLREGTVLFVEGWGGTPPECDEFFWESFRGRYGRGGFKFLSIPDIINRLSPDMIEYMFPGQEGIIDRGGILHHFQDLAGLGGNPGIIYKLDDCVYSWTVPGNTMEGIAATLEDLLSTLRETQTGKARRPKPHYEVLFRKSAKSQALEESEVMYELPMEPWENEDSEESLDPRARAILEAWEKIEREFGVTIEDLALMLGYKVKLSHLVITTSGKILLPGFGDKEVKMDDLTKAVYFFYLRHPEGARLKELQDHEEEILGYYMGITGRDDVGAIRNSVHNLLAPYGNGLNVCMSRVKKAFRDIVGDRIAKYYYIDGHYAGIRKVAIDRDHVIWEH